MKNDFQDEVEDRCEEFSSDINANILTEDINDGPNIESSFTSQGGGLDIMFSSQKERFNQLINGSLLWVISVVGMADPWQCSSYGFDESKGVYVTHIDPFWRSASWFDSVQPQLALTR